MRFGTNHKQAARQCSRPGRASRASAQRVGGLPAEAARLLARLGEAGAYARPDPLAEEALLVRRGGDGISVGSGGFAAASGRCLAAANLAA